MTSQNLSEFKIFVPYTVLCTWLWYILLKIVKVSRKMWLFFKWQKLYKKFQSFELNWHQEHTIDCIAQFICVCVCPGWIQKISFERSNYERARLKRFNVLPWIQFTIMIELHLYNKNQILGIYGIGQIQHIWHMQFVEKVWSIKGQTKGGLKSYQKLQIARENSYFLVRFRAVYLLFMV